MPYCKNYDKDKRLCKDYNNRPWMCIQQKFLGEEFAIETCNLAKHLKVWKDESNNKARCYKIANILATSLWGATKEQIKTINKKINSEESIKIEKDSKKYEYAFVKEVDMILLNNCLVKALSKSLCKSNEEISRIFSTIENIRGDTIPFKKAIEIAKDNNLSLDNIFVSKNPNGIWHAICESKEGFEPLLSAEIEDADYIGEPLSAGMAMIYGSAIGAGGGILGGLLGGGDEFEQPEIQVKELPGYPEADVARGEIAGKLKEWGTLPGYGAISPEWGDIWERAKGKVGRYYWGEPGETGLAGKVRAGAARRGVSESPAIDTLMTRMGQQEAIQLGEMGTEQAMQEALFGEKGRQDWFGQMQDLAGMRPSYATPAGVSQPQAPSTGEMVGELGSAITGAGMQYGQNQWMQQMMNQMMYGAPAGSATAYTQQLGLSQPPPVPSSYYS